MQRSKIHLDGIDYSPDIQIRVRSVQKTFEADCQIGQYPFYFEIELSDDGMKSVSKDLQARLNKTADVFAGTPDPAAAAHALRLLAEEGRTAFNRLFKPATTDAFRTIFQERLAQSAALVIQVTAERFSVPWDLLYCQPLDQPLSFDNFLGMRHIVSRIVTPNTGADLPPNQAMGTVKPVVGLLSNTGLPHVAKREIPFFEGMRNKDLVQLRHLSRILETDTDFKHIRQFLHKRFHVLHLACHADYVKDAGPKFTVTRGFDVTLKRLEAQECNVQGNPLVFLNACRTSDMEPTYLFSFARYFLDGGARAVIATECEVPDDFACAFSEKVYERFLKGKRVGECILEARRFFLKKGNPLGLMYSLYGPPGVRLQPKA